MSTKQMHVAKANQGTEMIRAFEGSETIAGPNQAGSWFIIPDQVNDIAATIVCDAGNCRARIETTTSNIVQIDAGIENVTPWARGDVLQGACGLFAAVTAIRIYVVYGEARLDLRTV